MTLRLIVLLALASLASAPAFASHGNPKDFSAVQRWVPKKAADTVAAHPDAPKCAGKACRHR